ncbi:MAG: hypothetical protein Q7S68_04625 [Deltaproteobacteria bacterium]|nr:hypothetical protein [Deltaproteobacteria bacterium]
MDAILIYAFFLAACGAAASRSSRDMEDDSVPDASTPDSMATEQEDGGEADAPQVLPVRDGINERWTIFDDCVLSDLVLADDKLYALCKGTTNRLLSCPIDQELKTTTCETVVSFDKPYLEEAELEVSPLVHTVLDDRFSVVTFTSVPDNHPGFYVVDRSNQTVTDAIAFETLGVRVGNDVLPLRATLLWGALRLGDFLLVAARNQNFEESAESYTVASFLPFTWNGDGTVTSIEDELGQQQIFTSGWNTTLFLNGTEANTGRLLNNGYAPGGNPTESYFDAISLDADGNPQVDATQSFSLGNIPFEPLKHFAFGPDSSSFLLASSPYGSEQAKLYVAGLGLSEGVAIGSDPIVSAVWYSQGEDNKAFVTNSGREVFAVAIEDGQPTAVLPSVPVYYGTPTVSALQNSEASCILYQGLQLSGSESGITAMQCGALLGLN